MRPTMCLENCQAIIELFEGMSSSPAIIGEIMSGAKGRHARHMTTYCNLSLYRVFAKLMDFFFALDKMIDQVGAEEVSFHASFIKSAAKRVLVAFPLREIGKSLELVYSRVLKHFQDERSLQQGAWRALQDHFVKMSTRYEGTLDRVYPGGDVKLAYSIGDALAIFGDIAR